MEKSTKFSDLLGDLRELSKLVEVPHVSAELSGEFHRRTALVPSDMEDFAKMSPLSEAFSKGDIKKHFRVTPPSVLPPHTSFGVDLASYEGALTGRSKLEERRGDKREVYFDGLSFTFSPVSTLSVEKEGFRVWVERLPRDTAEYLVKRDPEDFLKISVGDIIEVQESVERYWRVVQVYSL